MLSDELFQLRARLIACERVLTRLNGASSHQNHLFRSGESTGQLLGDLITVLHSLTRAKPIVEETLLGKLAIPKAALAARVNLQFFGGREMISAGDLADNHTVGTLAYYIAIHLAAGR